MNAPESSTATCPVMGSQTNKQTAEERGLVREIDGQKYYLCCEACGPLFDADPAQYTAGNAPSGEHEHGHGHDHHA